MSLAADELNRINLQMSQEKAYGKSIVMFHVSSRGQVQFISPIYDELKKRNLHFSYYLACDYDICNTVGELDIPLPNYVHGDIISQLVLVDVFLQAEIWGKGPVNSKRVFIGHGQPNKWTYWSEANLNSFEYYFLYGELERSMFAFIQESNPQATSHIKLFNVGYPKLDDQINANYDRSKILKDLGLNPNYKTVIYAPAWDPGGSLRTNGQKIVKKLCELENINIIVKLHPASLEPESSPEYLFYTGGVKWNKVFKELEKAHANFKYYDNYVVNPILFVSDIMVTDFSGVALEFMVLDRPVIYIDCPEFYDKTLIEWKCDPQISKNDDRFNAGRNAGLVVEDINKINDAIQYSINNPYEFSEKRKSLAASFLYNPGCSSKVAVDCIIDLMH